MRLGDPALRWKGAPARCPFFAALLLHEIDDCKNCALHTPAGNTPMQLRLAFTCIAFNLAAVAIIVDESQRFERGPITLVADGEVGTAESGGTTDMRPTKRPPPQPAPSYQVAPHPGIPGGEERLRRLKQGLPPFDQGHQPSR